MPFVVTRQMGYPPPATQAPGLATWVGTYVYVHCTVLAGPAYGINARRQPSKTGPAAAARPNRPGRPAGMVRGVGDDASRFKDTQGRGGGGEEIDHQARRAAAASLARTTSPATRRKIISPAASITEIARDLCMYSSRAWHKACVCRLGRFPASFFGSDLDLDRYDPGCEQ